MRIVLEGRKSNLVFDLISFVVSLIGTVASLIGLLYDIFINKHKESNPASAKE